MFSDTCLKTPRTLLLLFFASVVNAQELSTIASHLEPVRLSVVSIQSYKNIDEQVHSRVGSGFIYHADGYVITSQNVIHSADSIVVTLANGRRKRAWVLPNDEQSPLALLKIDGHYVPAVLNDNPKAEQKIVYIMGNSLGIFPSLGLAEIGDVWDNGFMEVRLSAFAGNSGAPLFNNAGEVIGMFLGVYSSGKEIVLQQKGLVFPLENIRSDADHILMRSQKVNSWIGISAVDVEQGVEVVGVLPDSPASEVQISPGDTIVAFDGKLIMNVRDLAREVQQVHPEQIVELDVKRGSIKKKKLQVDLVPWQKHR